jgi:predicted ATPase
VGREAELAVLHDTYERASSERRCVLCCILGSAGVGKSRLAGEFVGALNSGSRVLQGRCLPYGEGITYWPLVEVVRQAAGISQTDTREQARERLARLLAAQEDADEILKRVAGVLDLADDAASLQETFWAVRRLLESFTGPQPLVVVLDDLQWAEPTFLDLVEYLAQFGGEQPILLLGLARPELAQLRPGFAAGGIVALEPLGAAHSERLVESLLGHSPVAADVVWRVIDAAAGQPLFVVEYVRMLIDEGLVNEVDGAWRFSRDVSAVAVPASIQALLGARLDRLSAGEREVIQSAAVVGQEFSAAAVAELVSSAVARAVSVHLEALVEKQLIRRQAPRFGLEDDLSFAHLLIRDVAYGALLKQTRSELHERFAGWLARSAGDRVDEYEEILGYHLEQAYRYRTELGPVDDHARGLANDARDRLAATGRRALARGDAPAAVNLLGRAAALCEPGEHARLELLLDLASAQQDTGQVRQAKALFEEVLKGARAADDRSLEWRSRVELAALTFSFDTDVRMALAESEQAIGVFTDLDEHAALGRAWATVARSKFVAGDLAQALAAFEQALLYARQSGDRRTQAEALMWILIFSWAGPAPASEGIERCRQVLASADVPRQARAFALVEQAPLLAMLGRFAQARECYRDGTAILQELGLRVMAAQASQEGSEAEMLAGNPAAAEQLLRAASEVLETMGERGFLASVRPRLADALYAQGRYDEAASLAQSGREITAADDVDGQVHWRRVLAKILARRKQFAAAQQLAREAVQLIESTDYLAVHADAVMDLAEVLSLAGRASDARTAIAHALTLYERKDNQVAAERARSLLHSLVVGG